jgi:hypothetical protein
MLRISRLAMRCLLCQAVVAVVVGGSMSPPSIVTLIDVEHVMDGTTVRLTFYYQQHDNLTGATIVPVLMDPNCEESITGDETNMLGGGVRLEPVWIDAIGMLIGQASVDLQTASDGIWKAPAADATTATTAAETAIGTLRFCYGLDIYRAEDEQQVLVHAVRTKFTVKVNFVVVFGGGGGDGTDKSKDSLSSEIETEEQEGDPKLAVYRCSEDDDDAQDWRSATTTDDIVVTICIESRDVSQWTIDNVLESSLRVSGVSAGIEDGTSVRGASSASSSANETFATGLV